MDNLKGKFVIAYDTLCEGVKCIINHIHDGVETPMFYESFDEAFKEIFDDALSMLEGRSKKELKEMNPNITPAIVKEMKKINDTGNVQLMQAFFDKHPNANDNGEWVEAADEFIQNRKAIYTAEGIKITGDKL
jgi:hypothetical protein